MPLDSCCVLDGVNQDVRVCITKPNYIPYIAEVYQTLYIQNKQFENDTSIVANDVIIGSDVTDATDYGPVSVESGKTTINKGNKVIIKNNFTVNKGASLEIK